MDNTEKGLEVTRRPYRNTDMTMPLLGFGLMRLPQKDDRIDDETAERMVAKAMAAGCNYFDTAYMYHNGDSEQFVGRVLSKYPRDSYFLTSKTEIFRQRTAPEPDHFFVFGVIIVGCQMIRIERFSGRIARPNLGHIEHPTPPFTEQEAI